jgi:CTP:molybdopterin cytidylyltransferase MocA
VDVIVPIILAAGASSRMGRPKALLDFDGRRAIDLVLDACAGLETPIVVTGAHPVDVGDRATVVVNPEWSRGQMSSLKAGLRALPPGATAFLLFPVDCCLVTADDVRAIVAAWKCQTLVVPSRDMRRGHPVLVDASLIPPLLALSDTASAREVFHKYRPEYVTSVSPHVLMDLDTPEDYARALETYRSR